MIEFRNKKRWVVVRKFLTTTKSCIISI
jgi:hypothetical protein